MQHESREPGLCSAAKGTTPDCHGGQRKAKISQCKKSLCRCATVFVRLCRFLLSYGYCLGMFGNWLINTPSMLFNSVHSQISHILPPETLWYGQTSTTLIWKPRLTSKLKYLRQVVQSLWFLFSSLLKKKILINQIYLTKLLRQLYEMH